MADEHDVESSTKQETPPDPSRRRFLKGVGIAGAGAALADHLAQTAEAETKAAQAAAAKLPTAGALNLTLDINGRRRPLAVEPRTTLLSALRSHLDPPVTGARARRGGDAGRPLLPHAAHDLVRAPRPVEGRKVGYTRAASYAGGAAGATWQRTGENGAFYGTFSF